MPAKRLLILDRERVVRWSLQERLAGAGFEVESVDPDRVDLDDGERVRPDLVVLDLGGAGEVDLAPLERLRERWPLTAVVVTGEAVPAEAAVRAFTLGACHLVPKPFDPDLLLDLVSHRLADAPAAATSDDSRGIGSIIGESEPVRRLVDVVHRVAASRAGTVLIAGESGSGKDLVARALHDLGDRASGPFLTITCTAIAETLLETELFGHERGAFTDARAQKRGLLELGHRGTVFLDEIGDIPLPLQAKLLRVLEERRFRRVGGVDNIDVDVRIVAATHRDLRKLVEEGRFREDLFYRLNVVPVAIPPLRERPGDVRLLVAYFIDRFRSRAERDVAGVTPEALAALERYSWPGNVRELRNVIERAMILGLGSRIDLADLPDEVARPSPPAGPPAELAAAPDRPPASDAVGAPLPSVREPPAGNGRHPAAPAVPGRPFVLPPEGLDLRALERDLVVQALERAKGNRTRASRLLSLRREQVRYRIRKFGITEADFLPPCPKKASRGANGPGRPAAGERTEEKSR